jgi:hypothetical protein
MNWTTMKTIIAKAYLMLHIGLSLQLKKKYTLFGLWKLALAEFKPDLSSRIFAKPLPAENFWTGRN